MKYCIWGSALPHILLKYPPMPSVSSFGKRMESTVCSEKYLESYLFLVHIPRCSPLIHFPSSFYLLTFSFFFLPSSFYFYLFLPYKFILLHCTLSSFPSFFPRPFTLPLSSFVLLTSLFLLHSPFIMRRSS